MVTSEEASVPVQKKSISIRFLISVIVLGIGAYFAGPYAMTYVMYLQEGAKASGPAIESSVPEGERPVASF